ncbi:Zinc finger CCHC-type protein [Macrophomina phaseolina MS6]|uniref:Zinc finger CCHC-type protein n=1 Tax=Macrophomina phaseolina (strain MS6) TaxID=1126212 RepID=K2QGX5_MACPH|nr:Zinc finger CCHC-type protein [Macrophomina phaseolina MS6]
MAVADALRLGDNPLSLYEHAAQLRTQAKQLLDDAGDNRRSFRYHTIAPLIESAIELCDKALSQPTPAELRAAVNSVLQTANDIKKDTSAIKRTTDTISTAAAPTQQNRQHSPTTWARVAALRTPATAQTQPNLTPSPTEKCRELVIKLTDPQMISHLRSQAPTHLKERINRALKSQTDPEVNKIQVVAAKQLRSGDIAAYTRNQQEKEILQESAHSWAETFGGTARIVTQTYGVIVHGVHTKSIDPSDMENTIKLLQAENKPLLPNAEIKYVGWLTKASTSKKASSLVVEFSRAEDANAAIAGGMVWQAEMLSCELYDRTCKVKQCFNCQKYGHIGTQCQAPQACGYCAGQHSSKECSQKEDPNAERKCAACKRSHTAWSAICPERKKEKDRVERAKAMRPFLHPENISKRLPATTQAPTQTAQLTERMTNQISAVPAVPAARLTRKRGRPRSLHAEPEDTMPRSERQEEIDSLIRASQQLREEALAMSGRQVTNTQQSNTQPPSNEITMLDD